MLKFDAVYLITDYILNTQETLGLDNKSSLIGFGFDGSSVMKGQLTSIQKRIRINMHHMFIMCIVMDTQTEFNSTKHS